MNNQDWFNTETLALEFGIAKSTQAKYRSEKAIPYSKIGGFIYYSKKKIYEWLDNHSFEAEGA